MTKKSRKEIERGEQIFQLSSLVAGEFSLQEVLDRLAEAAVRIVQVKACSIRLLDDDTNDLKMRSTHGLSETYRNKGVVSKMDPVIEAAFQGEAVIVDNMGEDPRIRYPQATLDEGLVSQLTVAMMFRNEAVGVLRFTARNRSISTRTISTWPAQWPPSAQWPSPMPGFIQRPLMGPATQSRCDWLG